MCAASRSNVAPGGVQIEAQQPRRNSRASGCWAQGPLKEWNERGNMWPLFFTTKKHFQVPKLHYTLHKFQNTTKNSTQHNKTTRNDGVFSPVCTSGASHVAAFPICLLLTCILHFHLRWLHIFLYSGMIQWVGSISDLLNANKNIRAQFSPNTNSQCI